MDDLPTRRETLDRLSSASLTWLNDLAAAVPDRAEELSGATQKIETLRSRQLSTMITVALLGGFSSGKTFLASGLQGGLELTRVATGTGSSADKYVGLLPSAPTPTTACPARILPVRDEGTRDTSGRGFLRVRFMDSDSQAWEDVGSSLPPPVVAAYAMQQADATGRLTRHWQREVAEVEILISNARIPAELYDLPGLGSPNSVHEALVRTAMKDADCFIYIASATRSLSEDDLVLVKSLYDSYLVYKKPVIWVLTAIDRVMDLGFDDRPGWNATIELNNAYLRENFCPGGDPDLGFIGQGFIPASPALEARGNLLTNDASLETKVEGRRLLAESRMDELRGVLSELISEQTGRVHVATAATEVQSLIETWVLAVKGIVYTERIPIDDLAVARWRHSQKIKKLDLQTIEIRGRLVAELQRRVRAASRPFGRLPGFMHRLLDEEIRSADLLRQKTANQIEVLKASELQAWMVAFNGPAMVWEGEYQALKVSAIQNVRPALGVIPDNLIAATSEELETDRWISAKLSVPVSEQPGMVERASAVMELAKPVAGAGILAAGGAGISLPFAFPVGMAAAAAALLYGALSYHRSKSTSLDEMRRERIAALSGEVIEVRDQFIKATQEQGSEIIDAVLEGIGEYRGSLEAEMALIDMRIEDPENRQRRQTVEKYESLLTRGRELSAALTELN
jgi:hypothetical protein